MSKKSTLRVTPLDASVDADDDGNNMTMSPRAQNGSGLADTVILDEDSDEEEDASSTSSPVTLSDTVVLTDTAHAVQARHAAKGGAKAANDYDGEDDGDDGDDGDEEETTSGSKKSLPDTVRITPKRRKRKPLTQMLLRKRFVQTPPPAANADGMLSLQVTMDEFQLLRQQLSSTNLADGGAAGDGDDKEEDKDVRSIAATPLESLSLSQSINDAPSSPYRPRAVTSTSAEDARLADMQRHMDTLKAQLRQRSSQLAQALGENKTKDVTISQLHTQLAEAQANVDRLREAVTRAEAEVVKAHGETSRAVVGAVLKTMADHSASLGVEGEGDGEDGEGSTGGDGDEVCDGDDGALETEDASTASGTTQDRMATWKAIGVAAVLCLAAWAVGKWTSGQ